MICAGSWSAGTAADVMTAAVGTRVTESLRSTPATAAWIDEHRMVFDDDDDDNDVVRVCLY